MNETLSVGSYQHILDRNKASLTMNLEDGSVGAVHSVYANLGFICQGDDEAGNGQACDETDPTTIAEPATTEQATTEPATLGPPTTPCK